MPAGPGLPGVQVALELTVAALLWTTQNESPPAPEPPVPPAPPAPPLPPAAPPADVAVLVVVHTQWLAALQGGFGTSLHVATTVKG